MSGIVGILNLDGAPVDQPLLRRMADSLALRGPDLQGVWIEGPVGFGHALLGTMREALAQHQPASLDGRVWITADARIDGREGLVQLLVSKGQDVSAGAADTELILYAYHVWGEECCTHLLGDFAFAIWDGRERRLFCARDHFGVKPFYYAEVGNSLVFSNTLNCLRLHPHVSDELDDLAIADFLLFGYKQDPSATSFADIQRLPPAHSLLCSAGMPRVNRYWALSVGNPVRYKQANEYVEQLRSLLRTAVGDRLRTERVGVFMSGGLDSPMVAATAREVLSRQGTPFELRAHTMVYDRLVPDEEREYTALVATALDIPVHYLVADDYKLYERWDGPELRAPEPTGDPFRAAQIDLIRQASSYCRVVLTGEGGDPALLPSVSDLLQLLKDLGVGQLARSLVEYVLSQRRFPRVGFRTWVRKKLTPGRNGPPYPPWLNPSFAARLDLPGRWKHFKRMPAPICRTRAEAYGSLVAPYWQWVFENYDPGATLLPIEVRHPIFDVRVLEYLLAIPAMPWSVDKLVLREAMRGMLPERVRQRPKAPVARDPVLELLKHAEARWVDQFKAESILAQYVDRSRVPPLTVTGETDYCQAEVNLRPLSLNFWLQSLALL